MHLQRCECCDEIAATSAYEGDQLCLDCRVIHMHPAELEYVSRNCCARRLETG